MNLYEVIEKVDYWYFLMSNNLLASSIRSYKKIPIRCSDDLEAQDWIVNNDPEYKVGTSIFLQKRLSDSNQVVALRERQRQANIYLARSGKYLDLDIDIDVDFNLINNDLII